MSKTTPHRMGLVVGSFFGLWHLTWSVLVAVGLAQPILDLIFRLHMIQPPYRVMSFSLGLAFVLIVVTTMFGYCIGYVLGLIWNRVHRDAK